LSSKQEKANGYMQVRVLSGAPFLLTVINNSKE